MRLRNGKIINNSFAELPNIKDVKKTHDMIRNGKRMVDAPSACREIQTETIRQLLKQIDHVNATVAVADDRRMMTLYLIQSTYWYLNTIYDMYGVDAEKSLLSAHVFRQAVFRKVGDLLRGIANANYNEQHMQFIKTQVLPEFSRCILNMMATASHV